MHPPPPPIPGQQQGPNQLEMLVQALTVAVQQGRPANTSTNLKEFLQHKPPVFKGTSDPLLAEQWLNEVERTFRVLGDRIREADKVQFASYTLKEEALNWWATTEALNSSSNTMGRVQEGIC